MGHEEDRHNHHEGDNGNWGWLFLRTVGGSSELIGVVGRPQAIAEKTDACDHHDGECRRPYERLRDGELVVKEEHEHREHPYIYQQKVSP